MDMSQYLEIYIEESKEHLQSLNEALLQLEKEPDNDSVLNEIFRLAHTLKGMSGTMGFSHTLKLTHQMENVLEALRNNEIKTSSWLADLLFKCLDALESYTNHVIETGNEGDMEYTEILDELESVLSKRGIENDGLPANNNFPNSAAGSTVNVPGVPVIVNEYEQNVINKAYEKGYKTYKVTVSLNETCILKAARAFIVFKTIEKNAEIIKSEPKVQDIEDEKFEYEFAVLIITTQDPELIKKELLSISEIRDISINEVTPSELDEPGIKKTVSQIINTEQMAGFSQQTQESSEAAYEKSQQTVIQSAVVHKEDTAAKRTKTGKTVRVDIERLDNLMNLVSELIIQKTRLEGLEGVERPQNFVEAIEYLERITSNLHDAVMKVRMVPIETVFNRFPRMIRDISRDIGKDVNFHMSGEETELDRIVIDEIGEPLIHLLRNAVDHGIEPVEVRKAMGKPEVGNIYLRAYQDGNNVVIEVEEDGQGIDLEKVKKKAIEFGYVEPQLADGLTKKEIIDFLFAPSFSTTERITDLSGRGVGLDVVKTKIAALGGIVEVESEKEKGSKFIIRLPLTLAIIQALMVAVGDEKYAIQLSSINQIINIKPEDIQLVQKQEVILFRDSVIPIIRLKEVLDVPVSDEEDKSSDKTLKVVVVKKGNRLTGLVVDEIIGQQEVVQKSLGKFLSGIEIITSATILGDGHVALILDANSLVQ
jgi:two-component system chemotaxis sensor kinase CheA